MTEQNSALKKDASKLAARLFGGDSSRSAVLINRLVDICTEAKGKDFLLIHNPGGWGNTPLARSQQWERGIVEGISTAVEKLGYRGLLRQYFRTGRGRWEIMKDIREQARFFTDKARVMAAELKFIREHLNAVRVIMIGVSQGAAFSNSVSQYCDQLDGVYSIELGLPFPYKSRRVITDKTLVIDGNGLMPDAMMEWDVLTILKAFTAAPFRWIKHQLQRRPTKFTYCINVPGHEYNWEFPEVQKQIIDFLNLNFTTEKDAEVVVQ